MCFGGLQTHLAFPSGDFIGRRGQHYFQDDHHWESQGSQHHGVLSVTRTLHVALGLRRGRAVRRGVSPLRKAGPCGGITCRTLHAAAPVSFIYRSRECRSLWSCIRLDCLLVNQWIRRWCATLGSIGVCNQSLTFLVVVHSIALLRARALRASRPSQGHPSRKAVPVAVPRPTTGVGRWGENVSLFICRQIVVLIYHGSNFRDLGLRSISLP